MDRIKQYNEILGLRDSVNIEELKKLYKDKAKSLHPDLNSNPESHAQFVLLGEAYAFYQHMLMQVEEHKIANTFNSKKYPRHYYKERWNIEKRMAARRKAAERAKLKYEQFEKKGYYKTLDKMFFVFDIIRFFLALVLLFVLPVFLFYQDQFLGLIIALLVQMVTFKIWSMAIKRFLPFKRD